MATIIRTSAVGERYACTTGNSFPRGPFESVYKRAGVVIATAKHRTLREADAWTREVLGIDEPPAAEPEQHDTERAPAPAQDGLGS